MPKRKSRGNLQRQLKASGFDLVTEMVKLYPELTPVGKLNALQTLIKYLHPEPKQKMMKLKQSRQLENGNIASISASLPTSPLLLSQLTALASAQQPPTHVVIGGSVSDSEDAE